MVDDQEPTEGSEGTGTEGTATPTIEVRQSAKHNAYEVLVDGEHAGLASFGRVADRIVFTHTEVDSKWEGKGVGSALAKFALDDTVSQGLKITPVCPFIAAYIKRHPEYLPHVVWPV